MTDLRVGKGRDGVGSANWVYVKWLQQQQQLLPPHLFLLPVPLLSLSLSIEIIDFFCFSFMLSVSAAHLLQSSRFLLQKI